MAELARVVRRQALLIDPVGGVQAGPELLRVEVKVDLAFLLEDALGALEVIFVDDHEALHFLRVEQTCGRVARVQTFQLRFKPAQKFASFLALLSQSLSCRLIDSLLLDAVVLCDVLVLFLAAVRLELAIEHFIERVR